MWFFFAFRQSNQPTTAPARSFLVRQKITKIPLVQMQQKLKHAFLMASFPHIKSHLVNDGILEES